VEVWTNILTNFGPLALILIAIGFGCWRVLAWVGREMLIPLRDKVALPLGETVIVRVVRFCDRIEATLEKLEKGYANQTQALEDLARTSEHTAYVVERLSGEQQPPPAR
jgi:hypothetical protein